jgi:hypothetical protein
VSYPELYSDERVVLQAQNVKVKSVSFEVVLTTRRLVLIDTKKNSIPPQEINLATLKDVESGENAIRDPTITISIITISGNTRQMVLTFSKTSGGERRRECDDWVRALRQNVTSTVYHPVSQVPAPREQEPSPAAHPPAQPPHRIEITNAPPQKKRIEIARPMKKIMEAAPVMPVPVETTSLPSGSFCNRCGNRVPPESAFCNRCGTPVVQDMEPGYLSPETNNFPPQQPASSVPQVQIPASPVPVTSPEKRDRPIEDVIHSIEPLIEGSVPRTAPAPLVPEKQVHYGYPDNAGESAGQVLPETGTDTTGAPAQPGEVQWPVLSKAGIPDTSAPPSAPVAYSAPGSLPPFPQRRRPVWMIAVLILAILAVIAGVYVFTQGQTGTPGVTPTPGTTVPATTVPATTAPKTTAPTGTPTVTQTTVPQQVTTPSALVPASGVWVKVAYANNFAGTVGTPGRLRDVADSGNHFYQISTSDGPVVATIQKSDGSSAELAVDIYKDGTLVKHGTTTTPKGTVDLYVALNLPTATPTASP